MQPHWTDRAIGLISPRWQLHRVKARVAATLLERNLLKREERRVERRGYEAASLGRRTQGWTRSASDPNAVLGPVAGRLRDIARELVRNNPYAESALSTIVNHVVGGWGIEAKPTQANRRAAERWNAWAGTTACDADGRHTFAGLQRLVARTLVESGEVLVRLRVRRPEDGLPIPMQVQVLEPDFLDSMKHVDALPNRGRIVYGVELDAIGRRVAYWLHPEHPGSSVPGALTSVRVPAEFVIHVFRPLRPGQQRGASWFAPVILRMKDFDDFEDATLMKQKIAACLAILATDPDGGGASIGGQEDDSTTPGVDMLEPGAIINVQPGRTVEVVQPPRVNEYPDYTHVMLRSIAAGLNVTYEDLTGDYTDLPFSAARMSRLRHWSMVHEWQWNLLIPQFCDPVWRWAMTMAAVGQNGEPGIGTVPSAQWTAAPPPMIDPEREGLAYLRFRRAGLMSLSECLRERGYEPDAVFQEMADENAILDKLGLVLDSDPRRMTQAGQAQPNTATGEGSTKIDTDDDDRQIAHILDDLPRRDRVAVLTALAGGRR